MTTKEYNNCVDQHADSLYRFALKNLKTTDVAKDVVQDCFEKLWIRHPEVDYTKSKSYLFTAAYHHMVDFWRKNKRESLIEEGEEDNYGAAPTTVYSGVKGILEKGLERLPEIQRSVLMLRDYEGYSYEEIGKICDLNESQVKVYIYRARVFLKSYIGSMEAVI